MRTPGYYFSSFSTGKTLKLVLICLGLCLAKGMRAQEFRMVHYSTKDGLPSNAIYEITEDSLGFIWIGSENGLCRFDGNQFKSYSSPLMQEDEIIRVRPLANGKIGFVNLSRQLGLIDADSMKVLTFPDQRSSEIKDFQFDDLGNLWLGKDHKMATYDSTISLSAEWFSSLSKDPASAYQSYEAQSLNFLNLIPFHGLCWNPESRLMLVIHRGRHYLINPKRKLAQNEELALPINFPELNIGTLVEELCILEKSAPVRTYPHGQGFAIIFRDRKTIILLDQKQYTLFDIGSTFPPGTILFDYKKDNTGQQWVATNHGIWPVDLIDEKILATGPAILPQYQITSLHIDQNQNFWIGTGQAGVFCSVRLDSGKYPSQS